MIDITAFALKSADEQAVRDFLAADEAMQEFLYAQPGIVRRTIAQDASGGPSWAVITLWASGEDADRAARAAEQSAIAQAFNDFIDPTSVRSKRYQPLDK